MLDYLDEQEKATMIRKAISEVIREGKVLCYDMLKLKPSKLTTKGLELGKTLEGADIGYFSTDKESLDGFISQVEEGSEVHKLLVAAQSLASLNKLQGTYIKGIRRLQDEQNYIHPSFLLHTVSSYRSSSADPNFQNFPIQ